VVNERAVGETSEHARAIAPPVTMAPPLPPAPPVPVFPPVPPVPEQAVAAMHRPFEQQPSLQMLLAQQISPRLPHLAHAPSPVALVHAYPAAQRLAVPVTGQQGSPAFPQEAQVPPLHSSPS
jgi:hypothetical protein